MASVTSFSLRPVGPERAGIVAAVPGIEDDARDGAALARRAGARRLARDVDDDAERLEQVEDAAVRRAVEVERDARAGRSSTRRRCARRCRRAASRAPRRRARRRRDRRRCARPGRRRSRRRRRGSARRDRDGRRRARPPAPVHCSMRVMRGAATTRAAPASCTAMRDRALAGEALIDRVEHLRRGSERGERRERLVDVAAARAAGAAVARRRTGAARDRAPRTWCARPSRAHRRASRRAPRRRTRRAARDRGPPRDRDRRASFASCSRCSTRQMRSWRCAASACSSTARAPAPSFSASDSIDCASAMTSGRGGQDRGRRVEACAPRDLARQAPPSAPRACRAAAAGAAAGSPPTRSPTRTERCTAVPHRARGYHRARVDQQPGRHSRLRRSRDRAGLPGRHRDGERVPRALRRARGHAAAAARRERLHADAQGLGEHRAERARRSRRSCSCSRR